MKKLAAISLCLALLFLSACSSSRPKSADKDFNCNLNTPPSSLDPLLCSDADSLSVVRAVFDCLTRKVGEELLPAAAISWSSNSDFTQFTFTLRNDMYWRSVSSKLDEKTPVTAHDFVFAFRRAVDPATKSPHLTKFLCIKNAAQISKGNLSPDALGVTALNDYTLVIDLESSYENLPELLAFPAFAPCNREFFESTNGKYALEAYYMMTNGPFVFSDYYSWEKDSYIKLIRNKKYKSEISVWPKSVNFLINGFDLGSEEPEALLLNGSLQISEIENTQKAREGGLSVQKQIKTVWGLCFNTSDKLMENKEIRGSFVQTVDRAALLSKLPENTDCADNIIPESMAFMGTDYRKAIGESFLPSFNARSVQSALEALASLKYEGFPSVSVLCLDNEETKELVTELIISWNSYLGNYFNMTPVSKDELLSRVKKGEYQIALCPLDFSGDEAYSLLSSFSSQSKNNISHLKSEAYDALLTSCLFGENRLAACRECEKYLSDNFVFYPVYHEYSYYGTAKGVSGIDFFPYHTGLDFIRAAIEG